MLKKLVLGLTLLIAPLALPVVMPEAATQANAGYIYYVYSRGWVYVYYYDWPGPSVLINLYPWYAGTADSD